MSVSHDNADYSPVIYTNQNAAPPVSGGSLSNLLDNSNSSSMGSSPRRPSSLYSSQIGTAAADAAHTGPASSYAEGEGAGGYTAIRHKHPDSARDSAEIEEGERPTEPPHLRSISKPDNMPQHQHYHSQVSPLSSPYYNGRSSQSFHQPLGSHRSSAGHDDTTPPSIRQTRSEAQPATGSTSNHRGSISGSSTNGGGASSAALANMVHGNGGGTGTTDDGKNNYALWLPWEETALVDWLYEPTNCKLFNEPRRKKECHERIIRDILANKTSRAIEGKIRTLEKRYLKALSEIQRPDYATLHPGKAPLDVAEALCSYFHKLDVIFKSGQPQPQHQRAGSAQHQSQTQQKKAWPAGSPGAELGAGVSQGRNVSPFEQSASSPSASKPASATSLAGASSMAANSAAAAVGGAVAGGGSDASVLSVPRTSPPRISAAESLPYRTASGQTRKLAPKRGADGTAMADGGAGADADAPPMMNSSKRSRTFPASLHARHSPTRHLQLANSHISAAAAAEIQQQHPQLAMHPQVLAANLQYQHSHPQQQQHQQSLYQRLPEYARAYYHIESAASGVPVAGGGSGVRSLASGGGMPLAGSAISPMGISGAGNQVMMAMPPTPVQPLSSGTPSAAAGAATAICNMREAHGTAPAETRHSEAIQGTREELEWLQFRLRREELEFRKMVFVHEQDLEAKRMRVEESRLDVQRREMDIEGRRIEMQAKQMDLQIESLKSMSAMLTQMVSQMGLLISAKSGSAGSSKTHRRDSSGSLDG
ncbi:hypothetical protein EV174_003383 [Coemansia sp. RSA 2320]|nr:hypothetical protein EV174_003383 [Coemansia sp. RSA 2320]